MFLASPELQPAPQPPVAMILLTIEQTAAVLGVTHRTVVNHIRYRRIHSTLIGQRRYLDLADVRAFAATRKETRGRKRRKTA